MGMLKSLMKFSDAIASVPCAQRKTNKPTPCITWQGLPTSLVIDHQISPIPILPNIFRIGLFWPLPELQARGQNVVLAVQFWRIIHASKSINYCDSGIIFSIIILTLIKSSAV